MAPYVRELQVSRLPAAAKNRLVQCITGHANPRPIWAQPAAPDERWKFLLGAGAVLLVAMALLGGNAPLDLPWIAGWALAGLPAALGLGVWLRQRRIADRLPFPVGKYLFATELIDASDGVCRIYDLDRLTGQRVAGVFGKDGAGSAELQLVFGHEVQGLRAPAKAAAERVMHNLEAARNTLAESMAAQVWEAVGALDPLYEARYGGAWEQLTVPGQTRWTSLEKAASGGKFSFAPGVLGWAVAAALLLAPALWWGDNFLRDALAFDHARSADTTAAFKTYLARGNSRHSNEVREELLPQAAWRTAQAAGTVTALRDFVGKYPRSPLVAQAQGKLHALYGKARDHAKTESDAAASAAMARLVTWLDEHGSSVVQVRFGGSSEAQLSALDDYLRVYQRINRQQLGGLQLPSIATSFSREMVHRREEAIIRLVQHGFENVVAADVMEFERGGGFSGNPAGFDKPALTVQWTANLPDVPVHRVIEMGDGNGYLGLVFTFDLNLVVPAAPPFNFKFDFEPAQYLSERTQGKSAYDTMSDLAFDELQQRLATTFFAHNVPARTVERATPRRPAPQPDAGRPAPDQRVSSATGFCISPSGYLVTAQHFTASAREFKVVTKTGLVPADLVREDPANDMAVLKLRGGFPVALGIRSSRLVKLGESVATVGFPNTAMQGQEPKLTDGKISSLAGLHDDPRMFQMSVPIQPGNSGGPLFDMNGNVIGIVVRALVSPTTQNVNYAVKSSMLLTFLESVSQLTDAPAPATWEPPKFEDTVEHVRQATVLIEGFGARE